MPRKGYVKPPPVVRSQFVVLIVIYVLFLAVGPVILSTAEGEARPFVAIFSLIWSADGKLVYIDFDQQEG